VAWKVNPFIYPPYFEEWMNLLMAFLAVHWFMATILEGYVWYLFCREEIGYPRRSVVVGLAGAVQIVTSASVLPLASPILGFLGYAASYTPFFKIHGSLAYVAAVALLFIVYPSLFEGVLWMAFIGLLAIRMDRSINEDEIPRIILVSFLANLFSFAASFPVAASIPYMVSNPSLTFLVALYLLTVTVFLVSPSKIPRHPPLLLKHA